jgi:hypothetical protein
MDAPILLLRGTIDLQAAWRDRVYAQVTYDNELFTGNGINGLQFEVAKRIGPRTWWDLDDTIASTDNAEWRQLLYRAWVRLEGERYAATVGRQRYSLGVGRLWTPLDLFNPIFPLAIEGDRRIGQDGISARYRLARGAWVRGIWSPQSDPDEHRAAALLEFSRRAMDLTLMGGRFSQDWVGGGAVARNFGGAAGRLEGTVSKLHEDGWIYQLVVGVDYTFDLGTGLYAYAEHLYNTNRVSNQAFLPPLGVDVDSGVALVALAQISALDRIVTTSLHTSGIGSGYDLTPLLRLDAVLLYDWSGSSLAFAPALTWSARQDLELSLGGQLFWGVEGESQYGGISPILIVRADLYF